MPRHPNRWSALTNRGLHPRRISLNRVGAALILGFLLHPLPLLGATAGDELTGREIIEKVNQRNWRRKRLTSIHAAIAGTGYAPPATLGFGGRLLRILGGLFLLPFCAITTVTLFQLT